MKYFSLSTKAFYGEEHGNNKPNDCVEVTEQEYDAVKSYDAIAKELSCDANGKPILVDKVDDRTYQQKRIPFDKRCRCREPRGETPGTRGHRTA